MKTWQIFTRLIKYKPGLYSLDILAGSISWLLTLIPGVMAQAFFDNLSNKTAAGFNAWTIIVLLVVSQIMRGLDILLVTYVDITFVFYEFALLGQNLLKQIFKRPGAEALPMSSGEVVNRFRGDVAQISNFLSVGSLVNFVGAIIFSVVSLWIMLSINWLITLVVFVPVVLVISMTQMLGKRIRRYRKVSRDATGEVIGFIGEMFGTINAIQLANAQKNVLSQFEKLNQHREKAMIKDALISQLLSSISLNLANLGSGVILLLAAQSIRDGSFTIGDFALFSFQLAEFSSITSRIVTLITNYKQSTVSMEQLADLCQELPIVQLTQPTPLFFEGKHKDPITTETSSNALPFESLSVKNLTYRHPKSEKGIENISFELKPGSFTVITGRIGSGKSTLVRAIQGLLPAQSGEIKWNGQLIADPAAFFVPPHSAYTPQTPRLFSDSLQENILLGLSEEKDRLEYALKAAVLEPDIQEMPEGLLTKVGPRGVRLSGGQLQRTAIARMYIRQSQLLVLDDVSSALDINTELKLWRHLAQKSNATCLVVSHRYAVLSLADQILVLNKGKLEAKGKLEELLKSSQTMRDLLAASDV